MPKNWVEFSLDGMELSKGTVTNLRLMGWGGLNFWLWFGIKALMGEGRTRTVFHCRYLAYRLLSDRRSPLPVCSLLYL